MGKSNSKLVKCLATLCLIISSVFFPLNMCTGTVTPSNKNDTTDGKTSGQLHMEGIKLYDQRRYKEAIATWLKELKLNPSSANTVNDIGIAYKEMGDYLTAIEYHKKAIQINPKFGHAHYSIGSAYFLNKNYEDAIDSFKKAIELRYKLGVSYYNLGLVYHKLYNFGEAAVAFSKAIEYGYFQDGDTYFALGQSSCMVNQYDRCLDAMKKAEKMNPDLSGVHYFKGLCYKNKGFCLKALDEFKKEQNHAYSRFKEDADTEAGLIFDTPGKVGCRDVDAIIYFFTALVPIGFLLLMRSRKSFLKLDWKKTVTFSIFTLFIPMPLFLVALVGVTPSITVPKIGIGISLGLVGNAKIIGFLITLLHYIVSIVLNYLIVCFLYNIIRGKKAFWIINGLLLVVILLLPMAWLADAGGGRHGADRGLDYIKKLITDK